MSNIFDYIKWRGDITFETSPFNEIDALIFCQIEYNKLASAIPEEFVKKAPTLLEVKNILFHMEDIDQRRHVGAMINSQTIDLLEAAANSERFGCVRVCGYREKLDYDREEQFGAITYSYASKSQKWNCVVYRGTDDTLLGWKEDFNLSFMENVPSQVDGLSYLDESMKILPGTFMLAGHSKGGNLAMYASSHIQDKMKKRITDIYNFDGPGFNPDFFKGPLYASIENKEHSFMPSSSLVGMLFNHSDAYITVESDQKGGIQQHDPFSWQLEGRHFIELTDITEESRKISASINGWMYDIPVEQREAFIETVFGILNAPEAKTSTEFSENMFGNAMKMMKAASRLDQNTKNMVFKTVQILLKFFRENFSEHTRNGSEHQKDSGDGLKEVKKIENLWPFGRKQQE